MPASPRSRLAPVSLGLAALLAAALPARAHDAPGEYFFNDDPGVGSATPLPLGDPPPALTSIHALTLPLPAPPAQGVTVIGLRFRQSNGDWGPTTLHRMHLVAGAGAPSLSYAWGAGDPVAASPAPNGTLALTRPASSPGNADLLFLRTASPGAPIGPASVHRVHPYGGAAPARLHYALNPNPDPAPPVSFVELGLAHRQSPTPIALDLGAAAPGFHPLHLQLHDAQGGRTRVVRPLHVMPSDAQAITGLAYMFKPSGGGLPTLIEVVPLAAGGELQDLTLPLPASFPAGAYTLVLQLAGLDARLGPGSAAELFVGGVYDIWAATALAGREAAEAGPLADPDQDQIVNLLEFAFGRDPLERDVAPPYSVQADTLSGGTPFFLVEYRQRAGGLGAPGVDYTAAGLRYTVEGSTDLLNWAPFSELHGVGHHASVTPNGDGTETVRLEVFHGPVLETSQRVFLRLSVSVVP